VQFYLTPTNSNGGNNDKGLGTLAIVMIVLGSFIGLLLIVALIFICIKRRKEAKLAKENTENEVNLQNYSVNQGHDTE